MRATPARASLLAELSRAGIARQTAARLSIDVAYRPCGASPGPGLGIPVTECPPQPPSRRARDASVRAAAAVRAGTDPEALHAAALSDLLWSDSAAVDRVITLLQSSAALSDRPAGAFADLAAAHLARAERRQSPRDLLEAVEAAARAREADPANLAARWNLALALERLAVDGEAAQAWREYLALDSSSEWAGEARRHLAALGGATAAGTAQAPESPQQVSERGWKTELGAWADAVLAGDSATAGLHLRRAEALGAQLERAGRDATLADEVRFIRARAQDARSVQALALAHRDYTRGRALYQSGDYERARMLLSRARAAAVGDPPLRRWAAVFSVAAEGYLHPRSAPVGVLQEVASGVDTLREPALAGRALWVLGTIESRRARPAQALDAYLAAQRLLARAGEVENVGAAQGLAGELAFILGDGVTGYEQMYRALHTLRPFSRSVWRHNELQVTANGAGTAALPHAALLLQNESVRAARGGGPAAYVVEALLARAQLHLRANTPESARADLDEATSLLDKVPPGLMRTWLDADHGTARARLLMRSDPRRAAAILDSVLASPAVANISQRQLLVLLARANARLARADADIRMGNGASAAADLGRVLALLDEERDSTNSAALRTSLADAARPVFDQMVMLEADAGQPARALEYVERAREAFLRTARDDAPPARFRARPGETILEYALIGDTLLVWTVREGRIELTRRLVGREPFLRTIQQARSSLEAGASGPGLTQALSELYDALVRPLGTIGADTAELVVVADGEISAVPFAALWDRVSGGYLVERHPLRMANSLREAWLPGREPGAEGGRALVVAAGDIAARAAGLPVLPAARAEAEAVAGEYPAPLVLEGAAATKQAVAAALARASVFHYAGHAVFDDERSERSFLALAPGSPAGSSRLSAAEVEGLDLRGVRLVVLSACETQRALDRRSGGFTGFTAALMRAGAGGVVGTLWEVDDAAAGALVVRFHRAYRRSGDAARALREAQLALLRGTDPFLRAPSAWAAFRYAGS